MHEGRNGHLVASQDAVAFTTMILRYRKDRFALAPISEAAVAYTTSIFAWSQIAACYAAALEGCMDRGAESAL